MKNCNYPLFLITALSCSDNQQKLLPASSGNIKTFCSYKRWVMGGAVGEVIRENFADQFMATSNRADFFSKPYS